MRRALPAALVWLVALALAPAAVGERFIQGGYAYVSKERAIPFASTKVLKVGCKEKERVLSGGLVDLVADYSKHFISASYPSDDADKGRTPDNGWAVRVTTFDRNLDPLVVAVCAPMKTSYPTESEQVPAGSSNTLRPSCNGDALPAHGGYRGPVGLLPRESFPSAADQGWVSTLWNVGDQPIKATATAVCVKDLPILYEDSNLAIPAGGLEGGSTPCPVNAPNPIGGGWVNDSTDIGGFRLVFDAPFGFLGFTDWVVSAETDAEAAALRLWAGCAATLGSVPRQAPAG